MANLAQLANLARFIKKLPANAKSSLRFYPLPSHGIAMQAISAGKVSGTYAQYEKQVDQSGVTVQCTKTTYGRNGDIISMKDKLTGGELP